MNHKKKCALGEAKQLINHPFLCLLLRLLRNLSGKAVNSVNISFGTLFSLFNVISLCPNGPQTYRAGEGHV